MRILAVSLGRNLAQLAASREALRALPGILSRKRQGRKRRLIELRKTEQLPRNHLDVAWRTEPEPQVEQLSRTEGGHEVVRAVKLDQDGRVTALSRELAAPCGRWARLAASTQPKRQRQPPRRSRTARRPLCVHRPPEPHRPGRARSHIAHRSREKGGAPGERLSAVGPSRAREFRKAPLSRQGRAG